MRNSGVVLTTVFFLSSLLIISSCGVTVRVQDPVAAVRSVTEREREAEEAGTTDVAAAEARDYSEIVPAFAGSDAHIDDKIGFEEYYLVESDSSVRTLTGIIRRQFYSAPDGRSPLEIFRYYQQTVNEMGGTIIFQTRDPLSIEIDGENFISFYNKEKKDHSGHRAGWDYNAFNRNMSEYVAAKISRNGTDIYYAITVGRGGSLERLGVVFEVVTVVEEASGW